MKILFAMILVFFSAICAAGDYTETEDSFTYSDEKINFEITRSGNITATFTPLNKRVLYIQVIKGEANDLQYDPDAPPYALDIKIADEQGATIVSQSGTGSFIDKAWGETVKKQPQSLTKRYSDIVNLTSLIRVLQKNVKPAVLASSFNEWAWEIDAVIDLTRQMNREIKIPATPVNKSVSPFMAVAFKYMRVVQIRKKGAFVKGSPFDHSAIVSRLYSLINPPGSPPNTKPISVLVTCNHGTCASASTMTLHCSKTFTLNETEPFATNNLCDNFGSTYGILLDNKHHLCNNDTLAQYLSIKNKITGSWGSCTSPMFFAPDCE